MPSRNAYDSKGVWSTFLDQNSRKQSSADTRLSDFSSYLSTPMTHGFPEPMHLSGPSLEDGADDPMHLSGPSLEDDVPVENLKVPTNTPTAGMVGNSAPAGEKHS